MHRTLRQLALVCALAILPLAQALPARAVTVVSSNYGGLVNYITAIKGLDVGGTLYDISFINMYNNPDYSSLNLLVPFSASLFPASSIQSNGVEISQAIADLINGLPGLNNVWNPSNPGSFAGWVIPTAAPTEVNGAPMQMLAVGVPNALGNFKYLVEECPLRRYGSGRCGFVPDPNYPTVITNNPNNFTFALATLSPVPVPAALPLFVSGLGGLGLFGWRRRTKTTAARAA